MKDKRDMKGDVAILEEIRKRYAYAMDQWSSIKDEAKTDMKYVSGDPWSADDKKDRRDAGRPCVSFDEINQYLNQAINNIRQNKRGIKVNPKGNGADDKTAEFIESLIRGIEYESNAQRSAYIPAFESAIQKSYGYFRITREFEKKSFNQVIKIKGILNADSVLYDPDCKESDWSDGEYCFIAEPMSKESFKQKYPKAQIKDFSAEEMKLAEDFVREDHVVVCEYWKVTKTLKKLLLIDTPQGPQAFYEDEIPEGEKPKVIDERECEERAVIQYLTNGVEILEEIPQPGSYIPIIPVIGKEIFVDSGKGPKRRLISMVRLARDPQMAHAYMCSLLMEVGGQIPKTPFIGYKGQFESAQAQWESLNKVPIAYIEADPIVDAATNQVLPLPSRPQWSPDFGSYIAAKEDCRRAIQAAMGIMPMPTQAQRQNEKSGVALSRIQQQEQIGSFHFTDNLDRALEHAGRVILEWKDVVYDMPEREIALRQNDESHKIVKLNTDQPYSDAGGDPEQYQIDKGDHSVTISIGPSYQSQREEAEDFADTLIQHAPGLLNVIGDLLVKMRNLGPIGDEIAERLTPPQFAKQGDPQQAAAAQTQSQQQMQQMGQALQELQGKLQQMEMEKQAKVIENDYRAKIEQYKADNDLRMKQADNEVKIAIAEISTKAQIGMERAKWEQDTWKTLHQTSHEVGMQAQEHAHSEDMASQQQEAAAQQQQAAAEQQEQQGGQE